MIYHISYCIEDDEWKIHKARHYNGEPLDVVEFRDCLPFRVAHIFGVYVDSAGYIPAIVRGMWLISEAKDDKNNPIT